MMRGGMHVGRVLLLLLPGGMHLGRVWPGAAAGHAA